MAARAKRDPVALRKQAEAWLEKLEESVTPDGKMPRESLLFRWLETTVRSDGVRQFPYVDYADEMFDFWKWLEALGYAAPFQYGEWMDEFFKRHEPEKDLSWIEAAGKDTMSKFLFCLCRRERFHTGLWAGKLSDGFLLRLFCRVLEIEGIR